jgi:sulfur-oxidizing protein SoxY
MAREAQCLPRKMSRREALAAGAGALAGVAAWPVPPARAENNYREEIRKFTGGKTPVEGRVKLDLPELAENGNTVPMAVVVDPPAGVHVERILILAPANPNARVVQFRFSEWSVPEAATRIRLAETQTVIALARLSDGTCFSAKRQIKVTIGGCGG